MTSASMRAVAQQFLTQPEVPGLPVIFRGWDNQMQLISTGVSVPLQTLAALHILEESDRRLTVPAVQGYTMVSYRFQLQVCLLLDGSGDEMADAADAVIEAIKARLRSDPRMGQQPQVVFESAQGASMNITVRRGDIQYLNTGLANGTPIQWVSVEWTASEQITA